MSSLEENDVNSAGEEVLEAINYESSDGEYSSQDDVKSEENCFFSESSSVNKFSIDSILGLNALKRTDNDSSEFNNQKEEVEFVRPMPIKELNYTTSKLRVIYGSRIHCQLKCNCNWLSMK